MLASVAEHRGGGASGDERVAGHPRHREHVHDGEIDEQVDRDDEDHAGHHRAGDVAPGIAHLTAEVHHAAPGDDEHRQRERLEQTQELLAPVAPPDTPPIERREAAHDRRRHHGAAPLRGRYQHPQIFPR